MHDMRAGEILARIWRANRKYIAAQKNAPSGVVSIAARVTYLVAQTC